MDRKTALLLRALASWWFRFLARGSELALQIASEERLHLLDCIFPGDGIAAGRGAAPFGRVGIAPLGDVARRPVAVEGMISAGIDLDRDWIADSVRGFAELRAMRGRRPIVLLADEDEERRDRLVGADIVRHRTAVAKLPL